MRAMALGAAVLGLGGMLASAEAPPAGVFGVGVLRRDGIIVPFGTFDGKRWANFWPPPAQELIVPINLGSVPSRWWGPARALEIWQAWTDDGPQRLGIVQLDWVNAHCVRQVALRSDYRPATAAPPRVVQPYPKDGLAVSPPQVVESIAVVAPESEETRALMPALLEAFNVAERRVETLYGHVVSKRSREGRAPDVEAVYAFGDRPRIYYVEAGRSYRDFGRSADECSAKAFGGGWFARDGDGVRRLDAAVDLLPCNRAGASYMLPFGVIRAAGKPYWLTQFSGFDHERYVVIEIKPKTVEAVLSVWGGSCSR